MKNALGWILLILVIIIAYKAGWLESIKNYFVNSSELSGKTEVIQEPDGSTTTIRYKNVVDLILGR